MAVQVKIGDVFLIPLAEKSWAYAQLVSEWNGGLYVAIFGAKIAKDDADPKTIVGLKPVFLVLRRLCVALFHDGVRSRAVGDEGHCLARMRECYGLEDPLIEQEWYLARYEVQKADNQVQTR